MKPDSKGCVAGCEGFGQQTSYLQSWRCAQHDFDICLSCVLHYGEFDLSTLTTIYNQVYVQSSTIGLASYHFFEKEEGSEQSSYISYEGAPRHWTRQDGTKPPGKKYFDNPTYNSAIKVFKGDINWGENTFGNAAKWEYEMCFSTDFMNIESGSVKSFDI